MNGIKNIRTFLTLLNIISIIIIIIIIIIIHNNYAYHYINSVALEAVLYYVLVIIFLLKYIMCLLCHHSYWKVIANYWQ